MSTTPRIRARPDTLEQVIGDGSIAETRSTGRRATAQRPATQPPHRGRRLDAAPRASPRPGSRRHRCPVRAGGAVHRCAMACDRPRSGNLCRLWAGRYRADRRPPRRPARVVHQIQPAGLDARVHPGPDRAGAQYQRAFPSARWMTTACSATVARSRSISFRAAAVAAYSPDCPGRSGTEAAKASNAPCLATRQIGTTVERSAFHRSAASRCVACPVNACRCSCRTSRWAPTAADAAPDCSDPLPCCPTSSIDDLARTDLAGWAFPTGS